MLKSFKIENFRGFREINIDTFDGTGNLPSVLSSLKNTPNFSSATTLGITQDLDDRNITGEFKKIQLYLKDSLLPVPLELTKFTSENFTEYKPNVGVFIFPDCNNPGKLEDLLLDSLQTDDYIPCVDMYLQCLQTKTKIKKSAKIRLYSWLAAHNLLRFKDPKAFNSFNFSEPVFDKIKEFILHM